MAALLRGAGVQDGGGIGGSERVHLMSKGQRKMKKLMAGVVALLLVVGLSIGVAKGVFGTGEQS